MKKLLFLLLFITGFLQAQTLQNPTYGNTTTNTLKIKTPATVTSVNFLSTNEADGSVNKIAPINITIPYTPVNYSISNQSIGQHLTGIDTRLGQISSTTAGITQRVYFTADNTTVNSVTYFASSLTSKGSTTTGSPPALVLGDNTKAYFTKDVISIAQPSATIAYGGTYSGNLTVSATPTPVATQQRFTVEIYRTNNLGVPIASGVSGAPTGDLGVTVLAILDSGIINLSAGSITNVPISGILTQNVTINTGERIRYHVSAEKIGSGGGNVTFGVYYGTSYNSYYDVPVAITTDAVLNKSTVSGVTNTDALNNLNTSKAQKTDLLLDRTYNAFSPSKTITQDGLYNAFPSIIKLSNGNLLMAYRKGTEHTITGNGYIVSRLSTNNGFSWGPEVTILQDAIANTDYRDPSLTQLANGDIILSYFLHTGTDPYAAYQASTIKSSNLGSTWSAPVNLTGYADWSAVSAPVVQLANGDLLLPSYGHDGSTFKTRIHKSTDNGNTWTNLSVLTSETYTTGPGPYYTEPVIIQLANGNVLATIRNESTSYTDIKLSTDLGANWGAASQKFQSNSRCNMNLTFNNRIVFSYRWRPTATASLSSVLRYSDDNGATFPDNPNYMTFNTDDVSDEYSSLCDLGNGIFAYVYSLETSFTNAKINFKYASDKFSVAPVIGLNADGIINNSTLWQLGRSFTYGKSFFLDNSQFTGDKTLGFGGALGSGGEYAIKYDVDKLRILRSGNEFVLLNNGNLGLNTSAPINKFDVYGTASNASLIFNSSAIANFRGDSNTQLSINSEIASPFAIALQVKNSTAGSTAYPLKLNPLGGNVGVGNMSGSGDAYAVVDSNGYFKRGDSVISGVKKYVATLTLSGTSDPIATVMENTYGGTVVWTRTGLGSYAGTLTGAFTVGKTVIFVTRVGNSNILSAGPNTANTVSLSNWTSGGSSIDANMNGVSVEIRTYP